MVDVEELPLFTTNESMAQRKPRSIHPGEIVIGAISAVNAGEIYVNYLDNPEQVDLRAISTVPILSKHVGREVALLFNQGDLRQPIIMGVIFSALAEALTDAQPFESVGPLELRVDGEHVSHEVATGEPATKTINHIEAQDELVLKCGKASITLKKDGRILLRGSYLSSRSTGVNRIMGGSVLLN